MTSPNSSMHVESFFDSQSSTISHVIVDVSTRQCAVLDSVLGYDLYTATTDTQCADQIIAYINKHVLDNQWLLETHIHADHLSAAQYLKSHIGGRTAMGSGIVDVLKYWVPVFDTANDTPRDGQQFDQLFKHNEVFKIGQLNIQVLHTPGHTPACACYKVIGPNTAAIFVGDTIFAPQRGTARVDFPGGDAKQLFESIQAIYRMPDHTEIYLCHDYPGQHESVVIKTTVSEQRKNNVMLDAQTSEQAFIQARSQRDLTLTVPQLIYPAIQTNMRLGDLGKKHANGVQYIKVPVNQFKNHNSELSFNTINDAFTVSPQIMPNDVKAVASKGFKSIICNRPDGEAADQPMFQDIAVAAQSAGLTCNYMPFSSDQINAGLIQQFEALLTDLPKPIFAYCRSGTRCASIWAHVQVQHSTLDDVLAKTHKAGYELNITTVKGS